MSGASAVDWTTLLRDQVSGADWFWVELDRQARAHGRQLTGVDLGDGRFALVPPDNGFQVCIAETAAADGSTHALSYIEGDLVGPDAQAHPVVLAWSSRAHPAQRVAPDAAQDVIAPVDFFWMQLPIEALKRYAMPTDSPVPSLPALSFEVRWEVHSFPSVWLEIDTLRELQAAEITRFADTVDVAIAQWNAGPDGQVHYRGPVDASRAGARLTMYIDFGTAERDAAAAILRALDESEQRGLIVGCALRSGPQPEH